MAEAICPLIKAGCMKEGCLWYAQGLNKCATVALGIMLEHVHDLGITAYKDFKETAGEEKKG